MPPEQQPSPGLVDASNRVADCNPEIVRCAARVNLAHHSLSFPWACIFPKKRESQPPLSKSNLPRKPVVGSACVHATNEQGVTFSKVTHANELQMGRHAQAHFARQGVSLFTQTQ